MDLHEEDANISRFRRGKKTIAVSLALVMICVTLLILTVASAFLPPSPSPISVELFCSYSDTRLCITNLNSIVPDRFATPDEIVALCIQTAARDLQNLIDSDKLASADCSDPLRSGSDRIRESLARPKLPFLGRVRDAVVINWLVAAESDVRDCLGESPEVKARLERVRVYVYSSYGFVAKRELAETNNSLYVETHSQINYFGVCLCAVMLSAFGFVCSLSRKHLGRVSLTQ